MAYKDETSNQNICFACPQLHGYLPGDEQEAIKQALIAKKYCKAIEDATIKTVSAGTNIVNTV